MGDYGSLSGTSMSTPSVSGIVADLVQRYRAQLGGANPPAEVVKALLVNTAVDLGRPGPDYLFGHGLVDALAAVNTIDVGEVRILTNAVDQGDVDEYRIGVPSGLARLRVTANWIDPEGAASNAANDIVNDLDLEAIAPDGTVFFPFSGPGMANPANNATVTGANAVDTVENLQVGAPAPGFWRIRVRGTAVPDGPQNYAIVSNASFLLPDQPDIRVNAPLDFDTTCEGEFQDIPVTIFNIGGADLLVHSVSVASGADFSVLPNPTQPFVVQPGAHVDVTVRFSPSSPGAKLGVLEIASNDADESVLALDMTGRGGTGDVNATIEANGDFGDVALGSFGLLTLQVLNQGTCNLELTNVSRVAGSADFSIGSGGGFPTFPLVLGAGSHVEIPIRYEPSSFGLKGATFRVQSDDPDDPIIDVGVIGNSPPSDLRVSGSTEFGEVCAGVLAEQVLDICNVGLSDLVVSSVAFDPPCDDFTLVNNPFPANVSHDFCMPLTIRYTPTEAGDHECTLTIITNDPDAPATTVTVTGSTPTASIDVPPDQGFPATVIQGVGSCESRRPFPVSNTGSCPLEIVDVALGGPSPAEYALSGLPSFPIFLESGGVIGEGDLKILFQPDVVDRDREATLAVTYTSDPITGATETVTRALCGEGVFTGARVLVTVGGSPVATVEQIHLQRINANRNKDRLDTVSVLKDVPLTNVTPAAPCPPFAYHAEFGTVANQIQLLPGAYQVTATVRVGQRRLKQVVGFDVNTCGFNPTVVVPF
jgi:hypothetical protein